MTEWHAVDSIDNSIERTKKILIKDFNISYWFRLSLLVFLTLLGSLSMNYHLNSDDMTDISKMITWDMMIILVLIFVFIIILGLFLQFVSTVYSFVFIDAVRKKDFKFMKGFKEHALQGLYVFLFNLGLGVLLILAIIAMVVMGTLIYLKTQSTPILIIIIVLGILKLLGLILTVTLITMFTTDFVQPIMIEEAKGVLSGWRKTIKLIKENLGQFIAYILIKLGMIMFTGMISFVISFIILFFLGLITLIIGGGTLLGFIALTFVYPALETLLILVIILGIIVLIIIFWIMQLFTIILTLPIPVFYRCYSLYFLQKIQPKYDFYHKHRKNKGKTPVKEIPDQYNKDKVVKIY